MSNKIYSISEIVTDNYFLENCLFPTESSIQYWVKWLENNHESRSNFEESQQIIKTLSSGLKNYALVRLSEEKVDALWNRIQTIAFTNEIEEKDIIIKTPFFTKQKIWSIAASIFLVASIFSFWKYKNNEKFNSNLTAKKGVFLKEDSSNQKISNQTNISKIIQLSDGSSVVLSPNSELSFPKTFVNANRKVALIGTAIFEIAHDANRPFFVYANDVVTKVLGTKFKIISTQKETNVSVLSGKVSVEKLADLDKNKSSAIILLPNQQVIYNTTSKNLVKTLVLEPILLAATNQRLSFIFESAPLKTVFESLEKAYGINIIFDESNLKNCTLTADLDTQSLLVKLKFICEALNLKYEILDGQIVLNGGGCQ